MISAAMLLSPVGVAAEKPLEALVPHPLADEKGAPAWSGPQMIQADRQGHLFLLRTSTLEVYPLTAEGKAGDAVALKTGAMEHTAPRLRAAMDSSGDWMVREGSRVRLFRDGKEEPVDELSWLLSGVGMLRGDPVVSVDPVRVKPGPKDGGPPPLVLRWTGKAWEALVTEPLPAGMKDPWEMGVREDRAVLLLGDADGLLWVANANKYRIRRYSAAGRLRLELTVGEAKVRRREDAGKAQQDFERQALRTGGSGENVTAQVATAVPVIEALAAGRDGKTYFLVHNSGEGSDFALDRYDPARAVLERTGVTLRDPGVITMASGKESLYFAAFSGQRGRWKLGWEELDSAIWKPVEGARIQGLPQRKDEQETP
jgi:hypothetical protein